MSTITYELRHGHTLPKNLDYQVVFGRIEEIKRQAATEDNPDGEVDYEQVIAEARDPDSPLHPCFTWNRDEAAHRWNLQEARRLCTCYDVIITQPEAGPTRISPCNVIIRTPEKRSVVVSSTYAMNREEYREQVLSQTTQMLRGVQERLANLEGITPRITLMIRNVIELIEAERAEHKKAKVSKTKQK